MDLTQKKCRPRKSGTPPIQGPEIDKYLSQLQPGWLAKNGVKIEKEFKFKNFRQAIDFVIRVAGLAESEGHHPDMLILYNIVEVYLWTRSVGGLSENDFILAAKIEKLN